MRIPSLLFSVLFSGILFYSCNRNDFAPQIVEQEFAVEENSPEGTIIGTVKAYDPDEGQILAFEIIDGNGDGVFKIDRSSGSLSVSDPAHLDYESSTQLILTISVSDQHKKELLESSAKIRINVLDVNEYAPVIEPQEFTIDENPLSGQVIGMVEATDEESHQTLSFQIAGLNDNGYFQIDSLTGSLSVLDPTGFDYEMNQSLSVLIRVSDNQIHSLSDTSAITVLINDIPEATQYIYSQRPDGENGTDAVIGRMVPDNNYGGGEDIHLFAWTVSGTATVNRVLIDFDLTGIPSEATVDSAFLSLYFNNTSAYMDQHDGETDFMIQRITTAWEESTVTWNTQPSASALHQVFVEGATEPTQDFPDINITEIISDYLNDLQNSHGMLLKFQNETPYKALMFASSNHPNESIRPRLVVYYSIIE